VRPKTVYIFDYDGTLVEIESTPEAGMLGELEASKLNALADCPNTHVAILTGRALPNLKFVTSKVTLSEKIILIGTHGAEAVEVITESPYTQEWQSWSGLFQDDEHLVFEPKALTYAIHYKTHPDRELTREKFWAAYAPYKEKFRVQEGIGVFELMPHRVNKGLGIDFLHKRFPDYQLVFFGDDLIILRTLALMNLAVLVIK
jgi:trehalose 6-phosphate phosphatase